jgi:type I restriction enzyme S subunit
MRNARLGDVAVSMKNGIYKPAADYADDGVPCLRMYNIDSGSIVWRDIKRMRLSQVELQEYGLREGDLLVNRVNSRELVGKTACIPASLEPSVFESKNIRVRMDPAKVLPKFINYQLLARGRQHFSGNAQQVVGMASISQRQLADFPIVLTDVEEQRRIVAEIEKQFSRLDEAVANLKHVKANAKRLVGSILVDAMAGRLVSTKTAAWRTVRVCEAGNVLLGRQRAPQYLTGRWSRKYLRVANIKDDAIDFSDVETMDFDEAHFAKYRLVPGDVLVSEGQNPELLGQSAMFHGHGEPLCFQKTLHRFRADPAVTTPEFAQIVFRSHVRSGVFRRLGSITTNIGHLTLEKFKAAPFPLPPLADPRLSDPGDLPLPPRRQRNPSLRRHRWQAAVGIDPPLHWCDAWRLCGQDGRPWPRRCAGGHFGISPTQPTERVEIHDLVKPGRGQLREHSRHPVQRCKRLVGTFPELSWRDRCCRHDTVERHLLVDHVARLHAQDELRGELHMFHARLLRR